MKILVTEKCFEWVRQLYFNESGIEFKKLIPNLSNLLIAVKAVYKIDWLVNKNILYSLITGILNICKHLCLLYKSSGVILIFMRILSEVSKCDSINI